MVAKRQEIQLLKKIIVSRLVAVWFESIYMNTQRVRRKLRISDCAL